MRYTPTLFTVQKGIPNVPLLDKNQTNQSLATLRLERKLAIVVILREP